MLLAIDPGADAGWSIFDIPTKTLQACGLNEGALKSGITSAIVERPVIYPGGKQEAKPNDVIKLALRAGEWAGRIEAVFGVKPEYIEPKKWKGSIAKDIHHARIWARLTPQEQGIVSEAARGVAPSKRHNMMDAVGLGLYAVGRRQQTAIA